MLLLGHRFCCLGCTFRLSYEQIPLARSKPSNQLIHTVVSRVHSTASLLCERISNSCPALQLPCNLVHPPGAGGVAGSAGVVAGQPLDTVPASTCRPRHHCRLLTQPHS